MQGGRRAHGASGCKCGGKVKGTMRVDRRKRGTRRGTREERVERDENGTNLLKLHHRGRHHLQEDAQQTVWSANNEPCEALTRRSQMTVDDTAWCRCIPEEQRSARVKVGGRGTQGYSRHTLLGTGEHAEQPLKAKPPKSGAWLRGQMSVQGLCAQVEGAVKFP